MSAPNIMVVLPARGGSKRIPHKNIKEIHGQPMIFWPLYALSKIFKADQIVVSTDSDDVISLVETVGLTVPFKRPAQLSDDFTGTTPVALHALETYEQTHAKVDLVVIVYPTAVMLDANAVETAVSSLQADPSCTSIMSATSFPFPIQRGVYQTGEGYARMFQPEHYESRSQDLEEAYHDAGQFYVWRADALREDKSLLDSNVRLQLLPRDQVVDIDTPEDFEVAEKRLALHGLSVAPPGWRFEV